MSIFSRETNIKNKRYLTISIVLVILVGIFVSYSLYMTTLIEKELEIIEEEIRMERKELEIIEEEIRMERKELEIIGEEIRMRGDEHRTMMEGFTKSGYVIQNIKGDTIDTWLLWRLTEDQSLYINVMNAEKFSEKNELIKQVIFSKAVYEIDDLLTGKGNAGDVSLYYPGWTGALNAAAYQSSTVFTIPTKLEIINSKIGAGDISINLINESNADGYAGFTKSIADDSQNEILKSEITIYDVDNLTDEQFTTILRHELGHAFGLAHSTTVEDLMAPDLINEFPYISECDVNAIVSLYDNGKSSKVICKK